MHLLIAYFLSNMCAKYYENPIMISKVTAKNVGDVFFEAHCTTAIRTVLCTCIFVVAGRLLWKSTPANLYPFLCRLLSGD